MGAVAGVGRVELACVAVIVIGLLLVPVFGSPFSLRVAQQIVLFGGAALAWNLFCGLTGYWSFGNAAYFGIGAFAAGLFEAWLAGWPTGAKLAAGCTFGAAVAVLAAALTARPMLRLRGIYFAIGMFCFAEVVSEIVRNFDVFRGTIGITFPAAQISGLTRLQTSFYIGIAVFVATIAIHVAMRRARLGMGLVCIGQDEDTAAMMGVPTERYKNVAFILSAGLTSIFGALYGHSLGFVTAGSVFRTDISLNMIVFAMLGGVGTLLGPIVGAVIMIVLTQIVLGSLLNMHLFFTGLVLIAIVLSAPEGLVGLASRLRLGRSRASPAALSKGGS